MPINTLADYIRNAKNQGLSDETILKNLKSAGWNDAQISEIYIPLTAHLSPPSPPTASTQTAYKTSSNWDAFEHILLFISLYVLYTSLALTLHFFVDKYVVTNINSTNYASMIQNFYGLSLLRGYLAALIVSSPLFSFFFLKVTKRTLAHPEIRNLPARKFLIYLTLVITFIVLLINVISIIFNFLNGNVTFNFVLHFFTTILLSATIFTYYLNEIKEDRKTYV
ncbi:MAG: DUF5671 domain-containing protein [Candidatus Gottesmanbacteria bacterium]|nr:DUF5671 domain-containing protein [Candidatus Gottesmanbacteria bacterium]